MSLEADGSCMIEAARKESMSAFDAVAGEGDFWARSESK